MAEATSGQNLPLRSVSDDQLLSHSEAFDSIDRDTATSRLRCDSDDFENLTKSDDVETEQRPTCNHDVPENCSSSCWTFGKYNDAATQCLVPEHDGDKTESRPFMTQQFAMTKSKSSEQCCRHDDDATDHSACFNPSSR